MRPIRLVMRAFGPFAAEEVVDFRELGDRGFFLVHGQTGAGKTTLLDAMCFALYGESTGALRQGEQLRSAHAHPSLESEVILDFGLGEERYRVARKPSQERAKKRGQGTTKISAEATLWRRTRVADAGDDMEGEPLATQPTRVTDAVERLLGFECAQFRQVVVLPQGEFRRLLDSSSAERETILERLFDVQRYQAVQDALKLGADAQRDRFQALQQRRTLLLEQVEAKEESVLAERVAAGEAKCRALGEAQTVARRVRDAAQQRLSKGRALVQAREEWQRRDRELQALRARAAEIANGRATLEAARRAEPLDPLVDHRAQRARELEVAEREAEQSGRTLEGARAARDRARAALEARRAEEGQRRAAFDECTRLEGFRETIARLGDVRAQVATAERVAGERAREREAAEQERSALDERLEALAGEREQLARLTSGVEAARSRVEAARARELRLAELLDAVGGRKAKEQARDEAQGALALAQKTLRKAVQTDEALREAWRRGRAASLAAQLEDGEPCPVCGSADHPDPAHLRPGEAAVDVPDDEALAEAETGRAAAEQSERRSAERLGAAQSGLDALEARIEALAHALDATGESSGGALAPELLMERHREERAAAQQDAKRATEAVSQLERLDEESRARREARKAIDVRVDEARQATEVAGRAHAAAQAQLTALLESIPEALRPPGALDRALESSRGRAEALQDAFDQASRLAAAADEAAAAAEQARAGAAERVSLARAARDDAQGRLREALLTAGFADERAHRDARLGAPAREALIRRIQEYEEACAHAEGQLAQAGEARSQSEAAWRAEAGEEAPALEALERADVEAAATLEQAGTALGAAKSDLAQLARVREQLATLQIELSRLGDRFAALGHIAEVANGRNARNLTFQRFVLAAFLDEVLALASTSLHQMSRGRYVLRRARAVRDGRSQAGLDLVVDDAHTGGERPVATLSGGESFVAALALALGLAEVVQRHAGGIRLEAIFIDEGFGSLDAESLDLAVRTLLDLQRGGRLVGVISHVSELRERIDTRLEVHAERSGSHTRFVLG